MGPARGDDDVTVQQDRIARAVHSAKETRRTGYDDILDNANAEPKMYPVALPSKLEQQYMAAARARQKDNIMQKQVVWGKEFKGVAFVAKPDVIRFKDFDVGKVYTRTITLTNSSYTFNAFKLLPLKDEFRDFFEISFPLQGAMSAGTSVAITITFQPKVNEDIIDVLPALAQTGPFSIPLVCTTKKVAIEVSDKRVSFGQVVLAESMSRTITIVNKGALPTSFDIVGDALQYFVMPPEENDDEDDMTDTMNGALDSTGGSQLGVSGVVLSEDEPFEPEHKCLTLKPKHFTEIDVPARSQIKITMVFHPTIVSTLDTYVLLRFADSFTPDHTLFLDALGVDIPVFVDRRNVIDMECCYFDTLYRDIAVLRSRGKTSMRCAPIIPPEMKKYLQFVPKMGFIQPGKTIDFQAKFVPDSSIKQVKFYDAETHELRVPIQVDVQGQAMPISFTIRALVTTSLLAFDPPSLDFGPAVIREGIKIPVCITNQSLLPQELGFVGLPLEISVTPNMGFANLLPGESTTFDVEFLPTQCKDYNFQVRLKTNRNEEYALPVQGLGKVAPLRFSESMLQLKRCSFGEILSSTVLLHNTSKTSQIFSFDVPKNCGVTVQPICSRIAPGGSEPVLVEFCARPELFEPPPSTVTSRAVTRENTPAAGKSRANTPKGKSNTPKGKPGKPGKGTPSTPLSTSHQDDLRVQQLAIEAELERQRQELCDNWQKSVEDGEPFSFHRGIQVPCYIKGWELQAIFLEVRVAVLLPTFVAELETPVVSAADLEAKDAEEAPPKEAPTPSKKPAPKKGAKAQSTFPTTPEPGGDTSKGDTNQLEMGVRDYTAPQAYLKKSITQLQAPTPTPSVHIFLSICNVVRRWHQH